MLGYLTHEDPSYDELFRHLNTELDSLEDIMLNKDEISYE